jgi:hypothetical protein
MSQDRFDNLLAFLERLDKAKVPFRIAYQREEAISIIAHAPGEYWEIDFLSDGEVDVERYRSDGHIDDESVLDELFHLWADDAPASEEAVKTNDAIAGK